MTFDFKDRATILNHMRDAFLVDAYARHMDVKRKERLELTIGSLPEPSALCIEQAMIKAKALYGTIRHLWDYEPWILIMLNAEEAKEDPNIWLQDWAFHAVGTALGRGMFWRERPRRLSAHINGVHREYSIQGVRTNSLVWEAEKPDRINYDAKSEPRVLSRDQACAIASGWYNGMYDPLYAFLSTGCIQSEEHRLNCIDTIKHCIEWVFVNWPQLRQHEESDPNTVTNVQDLADLLVYVTKAPIQEVT